MKRCFALLLVLALLAGLLPASASEDVFLISGPEDLRALAELCVLDSRSDGLEVRLEGDIDLGGEDFDPIPLFAGRFDGQGHGIRGLSLTGEGSVQGLFRQIDLHMRDPALILAGLVLRLHDDHLLFVKMSVVRAGDHGGMIVARATAD